MCKEFIIFNIAAYIYNYPDSYIGTKTLIHIFTLTE